MGLFIPAETAGSPDQVGELGHVGTGGERLVTRPVHDDGANVLFDVEHFDEVAEITKPRKRRRLKEQQRQAAVERLRQYQFGTR